MMYISVFPIAISVRRTNVYEEKSLGIYYPEETADDSEPSYVATHLRRQLSFDLWFIFLGYFIITISEGNRLMAGDPNFSMFAVLFDIVSAYGTVGLSLGFPSVNTSFCGQFGVIGKLVIIAMQIRGRHRGLPYGLDRAILLPSEALNRKEAAEADARAQRRASMSSNRLADNSGDGPQSAGGQPPTPSGIFASGSSTMPGGAYSPYQRGTSARRGRSMSVDRLNTNLLSQFLAPGPTFPRHRSPSRRSGRSVYAMNTIRDNHIATANGGMWPAAAANIHPGARNAHTEPATPAPDVDNEKGKDGDGIDNLPGPGHASLRVGTADSVSGGGLNVPPGGGGATGNGVSSGSGTSRPHARRAETVPAVPLPRASEERE